MKPDRAGRAQERRSHLLAVARRLFEQQGFHQTGIAQIATESGIKVGQIYRDFASKEAIIAAICESDVAAWLEEDVLAAAVEQADPQAIWAWLGRFNQSDTSNDYALVAEIIAEAARNERVAEIYRALDDRVLDSLSAALVAIAPPDTDQAAINAFAQFILTFGVGVASRTIVHGEAGAELARAMMDRFLRSEMTTLFKCHRPQDCRASTHDDA
ncbi:TetR/AcrR family transcriptional regulator [Croceibacterium sp. TMG7-5b_MA50]|uniref:TetR/AcrR family transcriptional regulator n=1 Tax=Croceibacterium sp. TMG7-5b_MA50 TaxID=3121290 RepID=UPI003221A1AD